MKLTQEALYNYLKKGFVMQLASVSESQPWVCSVYFVADEDLNLYWLSWPTRRHSKELENNQNAAITIAIKTNQPIIGLGAEGKVAVVEDIVKIESVMNAYIEKYGSGKEFVNLVKTGKNQHKMYRFSPSKYVLVDEVEYPSVGSIDYVV